MKYAIENKEFDTKVEIIGYMGDMAKKYADGERLSIEDQAFAKAILAYRDDWDAISGKMEYLFFDISHNYQRNRCLHIRYINGSCREASYIKAIKYIPFSQGKKAEYIFRFGKYKGVSIYDVDPEEMRKYLKWACEQPFDRHCKTIWGQFLRLGYIPAQNMAFSRKKEGI